MGQIRYNVSVTSTEGHRSFFTTNHKDDAEYHRDFWKRKRTPKGKKYKVVFRTVKK